MPLDPVLPRFAGQEKFRADDEKAGIQRMLAFFM
jgi:hypothetical protein